MLPISAVAFLPPLRSTVTVSAGGSRPASAGFTLSPKSWAFQIDIPDAMPFGTPLSSLSIFTDDSTTSQRHPSPTLLPVFLTIVLPPSLATTSIFSASPAVNVVMLLSRQSAGDLSNM